MPTTTLAQEREDRDRATRRDEDAGDRLQRQRKELQVQVGRRERMVAELKKRLGQLKDGQDKEAAEIKADLDRVVAEMSKLRAELKGDRGDREPRDSRDDPGKGPRPEAIREKKRQVAETAERMAEQETKLTRQAQQLKEILKELVRAGKVELAEQMMRTLRDVNVEIEKISAQVKRQREQREILVELARDSGDKARRSPQAEARDGDAARRARHLFAAAKNLHAAGMPDLAEKLQREAEQLTARSDGGGKRRVEVELELTGRKGDKPQGVLADLVGELRALRRDVDELRGQMKRLQGERGERRQ